MAPPSCASTAFLLTIPGMVGVNYAVPLLYLPLELQKFGVQESAIGLIFALYSVAISLTSPYLSTRMDVIGRRKLFFLGYLSMAAPFFLYGLADYFRFPAGWYVISITIGRVFHGFGNAMLMATSYSTLIIFNPEKKSTIISLAESSLNIGQTVGPIVCGLIYVSMGFSNCMFFFFAVNLFFAALVYLVIPYNMERIN